MPKPMKPKMIILKADGSQEEQDFPAVYDGSDLTAKQRILDVTGGDLYEKE